MKRLFAVAALIGLCIASTSAQNGFSGELLGGKILKGFSDRTSGGATVGLGFNYDLSPRIQTSVRFFYSEFPVIPTKSPVLSTDAQSLSLISGERTVAREISVGVRLYLNKFEFFRNYFSFRGGALWWKEWGTPYYINPSGDASTLVRVDEQKLVESGFGEFGLGFEFGITSWLALDLDCSLKKLFGQRADGRDILIPLTGSVQFSL